MKHVHLLLACAIAAVTTAAPAHEKSGDKSKPSQVRKEQKPWGIAGEPKAVKRTVEITMSDAMRFTPDVVEVKQGETVRFVVENAGKQLHELVIGTKKELDEHAAMMAKFTGMEHDESYIAHVGPGKKGELVWHFNRAGDFDFACLIAGHYRAGMVGKIRVEQ
jgi:uncharacterized cupredoxin-like copper-binding protein